MDRIEKWDYIQRMEDLFKEANDIQDRIHEILQKFFNLTHKKKTKDPYENWYVEKVIYNDYDIKVHMKWYETWRGGVDEGEYEFTIGYNVFDPNNPEAISNEIERLEEEERIKQKLEEEKKALEEKNRLLKIEIAEKEEYLRLHKKYG